MEGVAWVDPNEYEGVWYIDNVRVSMLLKHGRRYRIVEVEECPEEGVEEKVLVSTGGGG